MNKVRWIPVIALVFLVSCAIAPTPPATPSGSVRPGVRTPAVRTPHEIVSIIDTVVRADLTTKEILIDNPVPDRPLILKLFRDFVRIPVPEFLYYNRLQRIPLQTNDLYLVSISTGAGMHVAVFQLVQNELHVIRLD